MNPFFWFLVLAGAVALWFALRKLFIWIGTKAFNIALDTKTILYGEDTVPTISEHEGENNNA